MFEQFSDRARHVMVLAQEEARRLNHTWIGTEHILLGLILEGEGVAAQALTSLGISVEAVRQQVVESIGPQQQALPSGHIPFTPRSNKVLELSLREALQLGHNYIGTGHLLLGLIRDGQGLAPRVLEKLGVPPATARQRVLERLRAKPPESHGPAEIAGLLAGPLDDILDLLRSIAARLQAIERHLGIGDEPGPASDQ